MSRIYWDTMLFIYWLEDNPQYAKRVGAIRSRMEERGDQLITGASTVKARRRLPPSRGACCRRLSPRLFPLPSKPQTTMRGFAASWVCPQRMPFTLPPPHTPLPISS